ncbi:hypothetical protein D3C76_387490 [compost metagenome]
MGQQGAEALMHGLRTLAQAHFVQVDPQRQGVDEHAQRPLGAFAALQTAKQHGAEHHAILAAGSRQQACPRQVEQAGNADPQLPAVLTQTLCQVVPQPQLGLFDVAAIALYIAEAERQGRFVDIRQLLAEERFVLSLADTQPRLGYIVAIWHRRLRRLASALQVTDQFLADHLHGGVVEHDVVELQGRFDTFRTRLLGVAQADQRCLAQVERCIALIAARHDRQRRMPPDHLHGLRQALPKHGGAQHVMPGDDLAQRCGKVVQVLAAGKGEARLQHIRVMCLRAEVVIENALLQRRQRVDVLHIAGAARHLGNDALDGRLLQRDQGQHARGDVLAASRDQVGRHLHLASLAQGCCQRRHGRLAEQRAHIDLQAFPAQARGQVHGQQRMATQLEEVVVPAHAFDTQHVGPYCREGSFHLTLRGNVGLACEQVRVGVGQRVAVELAMAGQRQCRQMHEGHRHQVRGQACLQRLAQCVHGHRCGFGEPGQQPLAAHQHHRIANTGLGGQHAFDLAKLHAYTTNLHLVVVTAQVVEGAVSVPAHQVTRAVQPRLGLPAERVGDKALCGQLRAVEVTAGDPRPANVQLAHGAHWQRLLAFVEHIHPGVGDRHADMQRTGRRQLPGGGNHRGLGGPIVVDQGKAWVTLELAQAIPPDQQRAQGRVLALAAQRLLGHRRWQEADRQRLRKPPVEQFIDVLSGDTRRRQVQHGPGTQRRPHLPGHRIEAETGHRAGMATGVQGKGLAVPMHQVGQCGVLDHHPFGLAGRAGGVDHVRQLAIIQACHTRVAVGCALPGIAVQLDARGLADQRQGGGLDQHQCRCAVFEQVGDALGRVRRVDRHVGCTGLEHGQQCQHALQGTRQAQRNPVADLYPTLDQVVGEAVGAAVQLAIAQHLAILHQRRRLRRAGRLGFDQGVHGEPFRVVACGGIEGFQHLSARCRVEDRQRIHRFVRRLGQGLQQLDQGLVHPAGDPFGADALLGQHAQGKPFTQVVDTQGQRVVAALLAAQQAHARGAGIGLGRCPSRAVTVVEQGAEQRRGCRHATATLGQCQGRVLVRQ